MHLDWFLEHSHASSAAGVQPPQASALDRRCDTGHDHDRGRPAAAGAAGSRCGTATTKARGRVVEDLDAAVAELRRRGASRVGLVGASMGGAAALIAGTRVQPSVAAVVSLSGEADPTSLVGGIALNAGAVAGKLKVPTMFVVATNDHYTSVSETRAMYRAVESNDKRLEVLAGPYDARHGWQLLTDPASGQFGSVAAKVAAFLTAHTRS
jgi:dienelactone hydrolase